MYRVLLLILQYLYSLQRVSVLLPFQCLLWFRSVILHIWRYQNFYIFFSLPSFSEKSLSSIFFWFLCCLLSVSFRSLLLLYHVFLSRVLRHYQILPFLISGVFLLRVVQPQIVSVVLIFFYLIIGVCVCEFFRCLSLNESLLCLQVHHDWTVCGLPDRFSHI